VSPKNFIQMLSVHINLNWLNTAKRFLCVLIMFAAVACLGLVCYHKGQRRPWLFTSSSSIHPLHILHGLIQKKYVLLEDNSTVKDSKRSFKQFSARNLGLLVYSFNSHWLTIFAEVKQSPYVAFFASFPLRSPPLFS
jgi:hypothetical protein